MSSAIYIVTKKQIKGFDAFVNGKAIGKVDGEALERLCQSAGVESLLGFISQNPEELTDFLDEDGVEDADELPVEEWFTAKRGLAAIQGLQAHLRAKPSALRDQAAVLDDLAEYERVLLKLEEKKVDWHFAIDF